MTGFNPNGAKSKWTTIKKLIREKHSSIVTMQETKCNQVGQIKLDGYYTFENVRHSKEGGGVAISVLKELQPTFVSDGGKDVEAVTIDIHVKNMAISITSAYGPQENALNVKKKAFWEYLHAEAHRAKTYGKGYILQGDLNAWLGDKILPKDLNGQNKNGKLFENFLKENKLSCVNSLPFTQGSITRKRKYLSETKESIIDFYVVCERVLPHIKSMKIDNGKTHILTNYHNIDSTGSAVNSDHFPLTMEVQLETEPQKRDKIEVFNFKDINSQLAFKEITSNTEEFTNTVNKVSTLSKDANNWLRVVKSHCSKAFKKIRIRTRNIKPSTADRLISERNKLVKNGQIDKSRSLDVKIARMISEEGRKKANMFQQFTDNDSSKCLSEMWKLKKSLFPKKAQTLPASKINYQGRLVSHPKELTQLLGEEYGQVRLRKRPTHPKNTEGKKIRMFLIQLKMKMAAQTVTAPFIMNDLEEVLKALKSNKAKDPEGIERTIFKSSIIGTNLKTSLLKLFNNIKEAQKVPNFMKKAIVTTIPKKGSKLHLKNERGIFLVNSVRSILMRLIFNRKYQMLDSCMSDSNVGGRKLKSGINHIWVVNRIIHDQLTSVKKKPIIIQQYDYQQMFDGMDASEACGDLFQYGVNDDHLKIIHEANDNVVINVRTPQGLSKEYNLTNRVMQGDTWASAMASAQVDRFGKDMLIDKPSFMYNFMGMVAVPLLGQVDDLIGIAEAGYKSDQLNSYVNVRTADKDLQFGHNKCKAMLVSKMKP